MTIRLRCAECQRKLKVPDEALGKKVQCPACGARFTGRLDTNSPPQKRVIAKPASASAPAKPQASLPDLQLEAPSSIEAVESVRDETIAQDEMEVTEAVAPEDEGVEPIEMEDESIVDLPEPLEETDAVDAVDEGEEGIEPEIVDEEESDEEPKPKKKKKKSGSTLFVWLVVGFVLLLAFAGGGYALYLYVNGQL